jgi:hypothetical protein
MRTRQFALTLVASLTVPAAAWAWTNDESPRTVSQIGSHAGANGFLSLAEGLPASCLYGHLYFDVSTALGKAMFATLTVAKSTGQKVRVGYTVPAAPGTCTLEMASLVN